MSQASIELANRPRHRGKILVIGSAGSGKTFVSGRLRERGVNAFDADAVPGLLRFLNRQGHDVPFPDEVDAAWFAAHRVVWDLDVLRQLLADFDPVYLFGLSGNAFAVRHLFDQTYFLRAEEALIRRRLLDPSRQNPVGKTEAQRRMLLASLARLQRRAGELGIPTIDAALSPEAIYAEITGERVEDRG